jgi:hypothetical protein
MQFPIGVISSILHLFSLLKAKLVDRAPTPSYRFWLFLRAVLLCLLHLLFDEVSLVMLLLQLVEEMAVIDRLPRPIERISFILKSQHNLFLSLPLQIPQLHVLQRVFLLLAGGLLGYHLHIQHVFGELIRDKMFDDMRGN